VLRRRTCFLWATPLTLTGFITSSTTQPHSLRYTAPPHHTTPKTTQHKSPWLSSASTRSSQTSVGTWTLPSSLRRALPFARMTVCECGALEHGDGVIICAMIQEHPTDSILVVTPPLPAVLVLSATIWYVTLCAKAIPAAEAVSPILPRRRSTNEEPY
jgi:hypothetical protein